MDRLTLATLMVHSLFLRLETVGVLHWSTPTERQQQFTKVVEWLRETIQREVG